MKRIVLFTFALCFSIMSFAQTSPNGKIKAEYVKGKGLMVYYKHKGCWQEIMSMATDCSIPSGNMKKKIKVDYTMLTGKKSHCTNAYRECEYTNDAGKKLAVRAYNDGVAWTGAHEYTVSFATSRNHWIAEWNEAYEVLFPKNAEMKTGKRYTYPALLEYDNDVFALLSESCMERDMAATSMWKGNGAMQFDLRPDGQESGGYQTLIIGSLNDVVESTLITDNSEPCKIDVAETVSGQTAGKEGASWIQPGVAAWVYWAYNHGSNDYNIIKKYTDMAIAMHLPYVLIDAEWDNFLPPYKVEDAIKYATDNGIKPIIWYSSSVGWVDGAPGPKYRLNKPEDREKEFAWLEKMGIRGVKIDFFSGDTNLNIRYMVELLESAARHHLLVNFHGATIPRGWQRTYPNLVSTEGVYGEEWYNNVGTFTEKAACHNATLPFTRNVIGPMDYTPCAFTDSQHPHITSNAHELALTVLYESGIQHLADRPESFLAQPQEVKDFLSALPAAWDETHLVSGYPGEDVVMARRKGNTWYIAGINGTDADKVLDLSAVKQLKGLGTQMTIIEDCGNKDTPWKITKTYCSRKAMPERIKCLPRGGVVLVLEQ